MTHLILASVAGKFAPHVIKVMNDNNTPQEAVFITTAANTYDDKPWMEEDIELFQKAGFKIRQVDVAQMPGSESAKILLQTQTLIVGGGNPIYLLEVLQDKGLLEPIKERVNQGMLYVGSSAGAVLAGPDLELEILFEDRPQAKLLHTYAGLNLCPYYLMPHWGASKMQEIYTKFTDAAYAKELPILGLNDNQAIEVKDESIRLVETREIS